MSSKQQYLNPWDIFKIPNRTRRIEPVKCGCCGIGNKPDKDCPVCGGKGVKYIITEM